MLNTNHKISIARLLCFAVMVARKLFGLSADVTVKRREIIWSLNLKEGIDFSIYLLGGFEVRTLKRYAQFVKEGDVVLDIGANIGAHTLPLSQLVGKSGKVVAFEPTDYAFQKLQANLALNPVLALRTDARQVMLMDSESDHIPPAVYSSWPLETAADLHEEHKGRLMATNGAAPATLDKFLMDAGIGRVDFIKLDVDGNECKVLTGGLNTIKQFKPAIMMELAPYVYGDNPQEFDDTIIKLHHLGYSIFDIVSGKAFPRDIARVRCLIPERGGINVLAKVS